MCKSLHENSSSFLWDQCPRIQMLSPILNPFGFERSCLAVFQNSYTILHPYPPRRSGPAPPALRLCYYPGFILASRHLMALICISQMAGDVEQWISHLDISFGHMSLSFVHFLDFSLLLSFESSLYSLDTRTLWGTSVHRALQCNLRIRNEA